MNYASVAGTNFAVSFGRVVAYAFVSTNLADDWVMALCETQNGDSATLWLGTIFTQLSNNFLFQP